MNKEVKEIKDRIKNRQEYFNPVYLAIKSVEINTLLDYINQLETNRDELKKILNNEVLDTLPFDVVEQVHNLFDEN